MQQCSRWSVALVALCLVAVTQLYEVSERKDDDCSGVDCIDDVLIGVETDENWDRDRKRRSSDFRVEVNEGQTTTFYLRSDTPSRVKPTGLITSTKGVFVNAETTTEYATQVIGTIIDGTYAKIQSTSSRVFSSISLDPNEFDPPTGLVSSNVVTRIRGETTSIETTEFVRTFIDGTYVQEILSTSEIFAPLRSIESIQPSVLKVVVPTSVVESSQMSHDESGKLVFKTAHLTQIVGERVAAPSLSSTLDDDKHAEDDHKILIDSFTEDVSDNNLRARKSDQEIQIQGDEIAPTKPKVAAALPTFRAGEKLDEAFASVVQTDESVQEKDEQKTTSNDDVQVAGEVKSETLAELIQPDPVQHSEAAENTSLSKQDDSTTTVEKEEKLVASDVQSEGEKEPVESTSNLNQEPVADKAQLDNNAGVIVSAIAAPGDISRLFNSREPRVESGLGIPVVVVAASDETAENEQTSGKAISSGEQDPSKPLGLISSVEGTLVSEGTTTVYTSLIFGTFVDGEYANVISSTSSIIFPENHDITLAIDPSARMTVAATTAPHNDEQLNIQPEQVLQSEKGRKLVSFPDEQVLDGSLIGPTATEQEGTVASTDVTITHLTTFTFFTTFFVPKDGTTETSVSSREVVSTEVELVESTQSEKESEPVAVDTEQVAGDVVVSTVYTTYTFITTFFDDRITKLISREEVISNLVTITDLISDATPVLVQETTTVPEVLPQVDSGLLESSLESSHDSENQPVHMKKKNNSIFSSIASGLLKTFLTTYTYFTTVLLNGTTSVSSRTEVYSNIVTPQVALSPIEEELLESLRNQDDSDTTTLTFSIPSRRLETSKWQGLTRIPSPLVSDVHLPAVTTEETLDELLPTTPTDSPMVDKEKAVQDVEIEPSIVEITPKTFYITYTFFTTSFTGGRSNIVSREETITSVVSDKKALEEATLTPLLQNFPVTHFTTFTYQTTSFHDGQTIVSSREETVTNVVTPGLSDSTESLEPSSTAVVELTPFPLIHLTTFFTTYTYYKTSLEGTATVISTSMETITNVVGGDPTSAAVDVIEATTVQAESSTARAIGDSPPDQFIIHLTDELQPSQVQPTGLLSTMRSTQVNDGVTTLFTTDVIGTFINGQYATILESSSEILESSSSSISTPSLPSRLPTGLVSVNIGTAFDIDHPETTIFTSKAFGTYVGDLYAQVIESTTTVQTDLERTVTSEESFKTGLVRLTTGSVVKDSVTTVYESRIIGTFIDDLYAQIIESSSRVLSSPVIVSAVEVATVEPTELPPSLASEAPTHLEGSIQSTSDATANEESAEDDSVKAGKGRITTRLSAATRSRTFTPVIRPFTQRVRPPLALKKKRPPFTTTDDNANSILPGSVPEQSETVTTTTATRSSFSRFRSSTISSSKANENADTSPKSKFFRLRGSSSINSINPTPVASSALSTSGRRLISSSINPTSPLGRSSISSGIGVRRSSSIIASSRVRGSSLLLGSRSSAVSSLIAVTRSVEIASATSEVAEGTSKPNAEITDTEQSTEEAQLQTPKPTTSLPIRRPLFRPSGPSTQTVQSSAISSTRRNFPLSRPSPLRNQNSFERSTESNKDSEASSVAITTRPRFVRPPKVTFTEKPRPVVNLPNRRLFKKPVAEVTEASSIDEVVVDPRDSSGRSKRQVDYDYYYYDRTHYRRPSRGSSRSRTRSSTRAKPEQEIDYYDYDASEDEVVTTRPRASSSLRDRINNNRQTSSRSSSRPRPSSTSSRSSEFTLTSRQPSSSRFRKPESNTRSSFRRPETAARQRASSKTISSSTEKSTGRRFSNSRRPSRPRVVENEVREKTVTKQSNRNQDDAPNLPPVITVTHRVPTEATIPVVNGKVTEFKTVITAKQSTEVISQYTSSKISGTWRYIASEISSTLSPGVTEITQYVIKPSDTTAVEFTPTNIRGRPTSFSHIVPSTVYDIEPVTSTINDPLAATNNLLQQLLLGNLGANPLLGIGAAATPVTSYSTHTTTYVTTLTDLKSTKIPITLRGKEIVTTIVHSSTSVITATEYSTQTIVITPSQAVPQFQPNPLASLLPALLGNQLLQAQLQNQKPVQPSPILPIETTVAPQTADKFHTETLVHQPEEDISEEIKEEIVQQIKPNKPEPIISVVTLYLSGRRPGEFSSVLSTVTLDGPDATVVKRQTSPSEVAQLFKPSALPFMVETDRGVFELPERYEAQDLDYYVMSAMNEVGAEEIFDVGQTQKLETIIKNVQHHYDIINKPKVRKVREAETETDVQDQEVSESNIHEDVIKPEDQLAVESIQDDQALELPNSRTVRRKTVVVTRKKSLATPVEEGITQTISSANRRRKVIVVTKKRSQAAATEIPSADSVQSSEDIDSKSPISQDVNQGNRRVVVITKKRPVSEKTSSVDTLPQIASSIEEPQQEGSFGDVYAPRTYYTVYSYLYTILNGPNSGIVSSREVSISEIIRGTDNRIPNGFRRTENLNGLYTLSLGKSIADLKTRVNAGVTTQVNLASVTLVKYGRGPARASVAKAIDPQVENVRRLNIVPSRIEPSFDSFFEENEKPVAPTQRLPSRTRNTNARTSSRVQSVTTERSVEKSTKTQKAANRGRGTVRFGAASLSGIDANFANNVPTVSKPQRRPPSRTAHVSISNTVRTRPALREPENDFEDELHEDFDDEQDDHHEYDDEYDNEFHDEEHDEPTDEGDYPEDPHEYEDEPIEEEEHDEADQEEVDHKDQSTSSTTPITPSSTSTSQAVKPTRFTISRKLINPLESHLSSIRAHSRANLAVSKESQTNGPSSSVPFRSRLAQRLSSTSSTSARSSTVVFKTFSTTSALPIDGGRSAIQLTLVTSTLTTLLDSDLDLLTKSPELFKPVIQPTPIVPKPVSLLFKPSNRLPLPVASSLAPISSSILPSPNIIESTLEDTTASDDIPDTTEINNIPVEDIVSSTDLSPSIDSETSEKAIDPLVHALTHSTVTIVETEFRTFTAVVTRKTGNEEEVSTHLEVLPELVTRTVVNIQPSSVVEVESSINIDENDVPLARAVPSGVASQAIITDDTSARGARLNINNNRPNLATKVMSNGVEVIIAGDKKPSLLAQKVIQNGVQSNVPITLAPSTVTNQVKVASEIENVNLLSSIQSDPAQFWIQQQVTTFTYFTTLFEGDSEIVSSREEVITNTVTQETGHLIQPSATSAITLSANFPSPDYNTVTYYTTYTYYNTFKDASRPVVLTSKEIISNVVTVPALSPSDDIDSEVNFNTQTYFRTYNFSKSLKDSVTTSQEVVTQIVVTEAPTVIIKPTPVAFSEVVKTYLSTVVFLTTATEGTDTVIRKATTVSSEIVTETLKDFGPTPILEGSKIDPTEEAKVPVIATKTFFTTKTFYTTFRQGNSTLVESRKEVTSSIVTETIEGFDDITDSLFAEPASHTVDARPTYIQLGPNLYGKLRTLFATATYFITDSSGDVISKTLVVPQVATETISATSLPSDAIIHPTAVSEPIATTVPPTSNLILGSQQLSSLKESFIASQGSSSASPEQPDTFGIPPEAADLSSQEQDTSTDVPLETEEPAVPVGVELSPTVTQGADSSSSAVSPGTTVILVTNTAGDVIVLPTEVLNIQPSATVSATTSSTAASSGGTNAGIASLLGGLGTLGLTALGQSLAGNNPGGLNINLGPVFDAMTGILSNGFLTRRNDTAPTPTVGRNPLSNPPPSQEPIFIPIGGLAGADRPLTAQNAEGRRPSQSFIPLKPNENAPESRFTGNQRLPTVLRPPEPGVPLQPGVPGSPLLRPGAVFNPELRQVPQIRPGNFQVIPGQPLTQLPGQPVPVRINFNPPIQTGFTGIQNHPIPVPSPSRVSVISGAQTIFPSSRRTPPLPPPGFVQGQNNIDRVEIQPSRPILRASTTQFFAANGQPINVPPLQVIPAPPPPPRPGPQQPVQALAPGAIVPGPEGKPVRIIGVPEGQRPPPGAEGHVFIRPVPEQVPAPRPEVRLPIGAPPVRINPVVEERPRPPQFQVPAVQTIASIEGDNKIVRTNIISGGQTIVIEPTDSPATFLPSEVVIAATPTVSVTEAAAASDVPEPVDGESIEVVGNILKPSLVPSSIDHISNGGDSVVPSHEFSFESESGEAVHVPNMETLFSHHPVTEIDSSMSSVNEPHTTVTSDGSSLTPDATAVIGGVPISMLSDVLDKQSQLAGVTSVIMGPGETFTTYISRVEAGSQTVVSTIVGQSTEINYVLPSSVPTLAVTSGPVVAGISEDASNGESSGPEKFTQDPQASENKQPSPTFPPDSPFNPPTQPAINFRPATKPTTPRPQAEVSIAQDTQDDNKDNKFVFGGVGGQFVVSQPSGSVGCDRECSKEKLEICMQTDEGHQCVCRPGYSRSDSSESCTKTYTYQLKLVLESVNDTMLHFDDSLRNGISPQYRSLASMAGDGLKQALMKTDLSEAVHNSQVMGIYPPTESLSSISGEGVLVDFFVQLKEQQDEKELKNKLMKSLEATNFSLGDTQIVASRFADNLQAEDFDECNHEDHNDCSEFAQCINERGTYRCQCKPGFVDLSDDSGGICLAELQDCEQCNRNGRCVFEPSSNQMTCICNTWFAGKECQVNLKVVMIVVLTAGIFIILLVATIVIICCLRSRRAKGAISSGPSFLRYRGPGAPTTGTLDRAAMIRGDTSSESSGGGGTDNYGGSSTLERNGKHGTSGAALQSYRPFGEGIVIPRAKHSHAPVTGNNVNAAERGEAVNREHQLLDYLDGRGAGNRATTERERRGSEGAKVRGTSTERVSKSRSSEALSAAGGTSLSSTSQFRDSLERLDAEQGLQDKTDQTVMDMTVSEARSFDETTIHPAVRRPAQYYQSDDSDNNSNFDSL